MGGRRAVFLDRDGVLNEAVVRNRLPYPPMTLEEVQLTGGARESVDRLRAAGFVTICITNQPDVARGDLDRDRAEAINTRVASEVGLDEIIACFHDSRDNCDCRKPKPGMILEGSARWSVTPQESYLVGDRWRDIDAGAAAGCRTVLIDRSWAEQSPAHQPNRIVHSLPEAVTWILNDSRRDV